MSYQLWWAVPDRVVMQRCYGDLTVEELKTINQTFVSQYLRVGTPLIHTVIDLTDMTGFPKNLPQLTKAFQRDKQDIERLGWTLVVGVNPIVKFFASIITQLWSQSRFRVVDSVEDAEKFLKDVVPDVDFTVWHSQPTPTESLTGDITE